MKWILILTLFSAAHYSGGASSSFGGEFNSQAACLAAGNAWIKQMHNSYRSNVTQGLNITPKALCVAAQEAASRYIVRASEQED